MCGGQCGVCPFSESFLCLLRMGMLEVLLENSNNRSVPSALLSPGKGQRCHAAAGLR